MPGPMRSLQPIVYDNRRSHRQAERKYLSTRAEGMVRRQQWAMDDRRLDLPLWRRISRVRSAFHVAAACGAAVALGVSAAWCLFARAGTPDGPDIFAAPAAGALAFALVAVAVVNRAAAQREMRDEHSMSRAVRVALERRACSDAALGTVSGVALGMAVFYLL